MITKIVAIVGSLRQGSLNRALLREAAALAPTGLEIEPQWPRHEPARNHGAFRSEQI